MSHSLFFFWEKYNIHNVFFAWFLWEKALFFQSKVFWRKTTQIINAYSDATVQCMSNNNLEITISWCPATETTSYYRPKILWKMDNKGMKARAMQHHYHGEANTVILFPFSTLAGTFSPGDRDKAHFHQEKGIRGRGGGCWGRGTDSIFVFSFFCPTINLFHLMTTNLPTWHAEIHLGCKLSLLTKQAGFCRFILLFFEVPLLQVLF